MRVALVVSGGVDRSARAIVPAFQWLIERLTRRADLTIEVVALHFEPAPIQYTLWGAPVWDLGTRGVPPGLRRVVQRRRLAAWLAQRPRFDVVHAWWAIPAGWVATAAIGRTGPAVIVTTSSGEFAALAAQEYGFQRRWIDRRLISRTLSRAAAVTVPTHYQAAWARRHGVEPVVIAHGVPAEWIARRPDPPSPWRLAQIAHINRVKDHDTSLAALAHARARGLDVRLDVVGGDTRQRAVERLASTLGLRDYVTFHGACDSNHVREVLRRAHAHVLSSRHEGGGVAVLEAAALGVPTIGTAVGYIADWAPDAAVAVAPGDAAALGDAIVDVLSDPARRAALADQAHARALAHDADAMADAFARLYHAAALSRRPASTTP